MTLSEVTEIWDCILYTVYNAYSDFVFLLSHFVFAGLYRRTNLLKTFIQVRDVSLL